jgi:hypothetical protein
MGNKSLSKKKILLNDSNLRYRNDIIKQSTWNDADIKAHQAKMIERFLNTFPLPDCMSNSDNWDVKKAVVSAGTISPFDDNLEDVVPHRKPISVLVDDEVEDVKDWQGVYLAFLRRLREDHQVAFGQMVNRVEGDFVTKRRNWPHIGTNSILKTIIDGEPEAVKRYKRLSDDAKCESIDINKDDGDEIYVYINQTAIDLIRKIQDAMSFAGMSEDSVVIELKE